MFLVECLYWEALLQTIFAIFVSSSISPCAFIYLFNRYGSKLARPAPMNYYQFVYHIPRLPVFPLPLAMHLKTFLGTQPLPFYPIDSVFYSYFWQSAQFLFHKLHLFDVRDSPATDTKNRISAASSQLLFFPFKVHTFDSYVKTGIVSVEVHWYFNQGLVYVIPTRIK